MKTYFILVLFSIIFVQQNTFANNKIHAKNKHEQTSKVEKLTPDQQEREKLGLKINAGTVVGVIAYDRKHDVVELQIVKEPEVGPNLAPIENFIEATGESDFKNRILRDPSQVIGTQYTLKKKLWLIDPTELPERFKEIKKQKKK